MFNSDGYSLSDIAAVSGNRGDGFFGGNSGWWIILLFLFALGGWGNNGGWGNGFNSAVPFALNMDNNSDRFYDLNTSMLNGFANTTAAVTSGTSAIQSDICGLGLQVCQGVNNIQQSINANTMAGMQNTFGLTNQLSNMQAAQQLANCQTDQNVTNGFATLNYNLATEACADRAAVTTGVRDVIDNANNNTRQILDFLVQDRLNALTTENQALKGQISQSEQNAYLLSRLAPTASPAYLVANPYTGAYGYPNYGWNNGWGNGCGCGCSGNLVG